MITFLQNSFKNSIRFLPIITFLRQSNNISPQAKAAFIDFKAILDGTKQGTLNPYMYWGKKDYFDQLVTQNKDYYLYNDEIDLINSNTDKIRTQLHDCDTIVDLGPGSEASFIKKTVPFIQNIKNLSKYYSVDISKKYANSAANLAKQFKQNLISKPIIGDMEKLSLPRCFHQQHNNQNSKKLFLFTGSTLSSFTDERIDAFLEKISSYMVDGDYLLLTFDVNHDKKSLLKAYNNPFAKNLVMNSMTTINTLLGKKIDFNQCRFNCKWNNNSKTVEYYFSSINSQKIPHNDTYLYIKSNKQYHIVSSRKFDNIKIIDIFLNKNFKIVTKFTADQDRMRTYVFTLNKKPGH